jgi:hypothetical protein
MLDPITKLCSRALLLLLLGGGCAAKQATPAPEGAPVTEEAPEKMAKDPNPGPRPNLSLANPDDLWPLLHSGYSVIVVSGAVLSEEPTPDFDGDEPPAALAELQSMMVTQSLSPEVKIVDDVLRADYEVLQIIPATSHPIGRLDVAVEISGPGEDGNRRVRSTLGFSYEMSSKGGEAEAPMAAGANDEERYANFRAAIREALAQAFKKLEADQGLMVLPF